jgi:hypothetical protein
MGREGLEPSTLSRRGTLRPFAAGGGLALGCRFALTGGAPFAAVSGSCVAQALPPYACSMATLSEQLFGCPWDQLGLTEIEQFFDEVSEEGLTWEAKGGTFGAHLVRKAACAFANSERGGFLTRRGSGACSRRYQAAAARVGS